MGTGMCVKISKLQLLISGLIAFGILTRAGALADPVATLAKDDGVSDRKANIELGSNNKAGSNGTDSNLQIRTDVPAYAHVQSSASEASASTIGQSQSGVDPDDGENSGEASDSIPTNDVAEIVNEESESESPHIKYRASKENDRTEISVPKSVSGDVANRSVDFVHALSSDDVLDDTAHSSDPGDVTPLVRQSAAGEVPPASRLNFDYHKPVFPLDWGTDGLTITFAVLGLMIAASGGIGGGGILVPLFIICLGFKPKHAIALSNFTIFGGSIANTVVNCRKKHPTMKDRPLIDWDLILIMEPLTIFGAVFGSLLSKVLPNVALTVMLILILAFMGRRTLKKGVKMWQEESSQSAHLLKDKFMDVPMPKDYIDAETDNHATPSREPCACDSVEKDQGDSYFQFLSDIDEKPNPWREFGVNCKIASLTVCFGGICLLTVLKGGGQFRSPFDVECGSQGYWLLYFGNVPWVLGFAFAFRFLLVGEYKQKLNAGYQFAPGEVKWDSWNTIKYPIYCSLAGLMAGLFGVGGGIVKGPLMLEMGIPPPVASASAAAMILFTSAAASTSFVVFGLLHLGYGAIFWVIGFVSTLVGQYGVSALFKKHGRESPIVLSIGFVISISAILVFVNTVFSLMGPSAADFFKPHGVCSAEARL